MTIQSFMREIARMLGDSDGSLVSKEFIMQSINEEARYVLAKFPLKQRIEHTPAADANVILLADIFGDGEPISIKHVFVNGCELDGLSANEIERLVGE